MDKADKLDMIGVVPVTSSKHVSGTYELPVRKVPTLKSSLIERLEVNVY